MMINDESPSDTIPSMDLHITREDAQEILKASEALQSCIDVLKTQKKSSSAEGKETGSEVKDSKVHDSATAENESSLPSSLTMVTDVLLEASMTCDDRLIQAFVGELKIQGFSKFEIQACLFLFLDAERDWKMKSAFKSICKNSLHARKEEIFEEKEFDDDMDVSGSDSEAAMTGTLSKSGSTTFFRCLLTAICLCVRGKYIDSNRKIDLKVREREENDNSSNKARKECEKSSPSLLAKMEIENAETSDLTTEIIVKQEDISAEKQSETIRNLPSFESAGKAPLNNNPHQLSSATISEITKIATFATSTLYEKLEDKPENNLSFEKFYSWFKVTGSSIVPWLELMDLAEWQHHQHRECSPVRTSPTKKEHVVEPEIVKVKAEGSPPLRGVKVESEDMTPNFFLTEEESSTRTDPPPSKTLVTFDFTGASSVDGEKISTGHSPLCINISEDNLVTLKSLVERTGLASRNPHDLCEVLMRHARRLEINGRKVAALHKDDFGKCIRDIVPPESASTFSRSEMEHFSIHFTNFFACYENNRFLGKDLIDVNEFSVGLSLLCSGNKSSKLTNGFELMDEDHTGYLTTDQLTDYIRSYLTMLVGISLLSENPEKHESMSKRRKKDMIDAVRNGAKWTLNHFLKVNSNCKGRFTFDVFASWYTNGGFKIAPWLELLDLKKLLSLLPDPLGGRGLPRVAPSSVFRHDTKYQSSPRRKIGGGNSPIPSSDVLFTFPLAKERSLVVLREDATYVRSVVEKLGLLSHSPNEVWNILYDRVQKLAPLPNQPWNRSRHRKVGKGKCVDVDQHMFVRSMEDLIHEMGSSRKRQSTEMSPTVKETLENFFQSFDLELVQSVALNQLMGGLSLLCGGKKSTKLAFSFGLFNSQDSKGKPAKNPSLKEDELFVFLRSFLVVMFSCCRQSLDLSAEAVSRYISDTSYMVSQDVMRYQWDIRKKDRVDFDEFGEWYNEGGFETAPWLELLDLNKWVLVENLDAVEHHRQPVPPSAAAKLRSGSVDYCPPPPPEDAVDASFFGDDDNPIMGMDSMDDMDLMLMPQPSQDKENDGNMCSKPTPSPRNTRRSPSNALKFQLVSYEDHGGYMVSVSQKRVRHLRHVLVESGLCRVDSEAACKKIMSKACQIKRKGTIVYQLEKGDFDSAMRSIIGSGRGKNDMSIETQRALSDILAFVFRAFDRENNGKVDATEVACGFTVLCDGKKSDKLEYAFEVLDINNNGRLNRMQVSNYLRSFLTVLVCVTTSSHLVCNISEDSFLHMNGKPCNGDAGTISNAADKGSTWAAGQAFKGSYSGRKERDHLNFDEFAEWYTRKGYSSIPWLELLDLKKWVITE